MKTLDQLMAEGKFAITLDHERGKGKINVPYFFNTITGELIPTDKSVAKGLKMGMPREFLKEPGVVFNSKKEIQDAAKKDPVLAKILKKHTTSIMAL
jgi:hypothetical protein